MIKIDHIECRRVDDAASVAQNTSLPIRFFICEISVTQWRWTAYERRLASENTFRTKIF